MKWLGYVLGIITFLLLFWVVRQFVDSTIAVIITVLLIVAAVQGVKKIKSLP